MNGLKGLRNGAIFSFFFAMAVLLVGGYYANDEVPPYPAKVIEGEKVLTNLEEIKSGQEVYQKYGLMDHGSVWGHGSLRGPDFSAQTAHLVGQSMREFLSEKVGHKYSELPPETKASIDFQVISDLKSNRYDPVSGALTLTPAQSFAFGKVKEYWTDLFKTGDVKMDGSPSNGFLPNTVMDETERSAISAFFFWTGWAAYTNKPGRNFTYTNNWPPDKSIGNELSSEAFLWSAVSIIILLVVLGLIIYIVHRYRFFYGHPKGVEVANEMVKMNLTNSQVKASKYFLVVGLLFVLQTCMGGLLGHYTVHPGNFYLNAVAQFIPYSWAKSWHLQLAIFWIATSWIASSLYISPLICGKEPKGQGLLVDILFGAILLVALGSLTGEVLGIKNLLGKYWYYFGHQGWEFLELGRIWQILLFGGLCAWLVIVARTLKDKLFGPKAESSGIVLFYTLSAIAVVGFFGFGLFFTKGTHLTIADYWRWFVVHIWVESIFEFFGVAVIALFLVTLGLVNKESAMRASYLTAILTFTSGIMGTAHHYYWYGGGAHWLAIGAVFSSLEPVPLILLVVRAWMEYKSIQDAGNDFPYRWPLFFIIASSFWNFLGAGVFGFLINLPVINYYEHGTYLTANHGHAALFGVYGMLSIATILFSWRSMVKNEHWSNGTLKLIFFGMNLGLLAMTLGTLLPVGISQLLASYNTGLWFARSGDFYNTPLVQTLGQLRILPDTIIICLGAIPLFLFLVTTYPRLKPVGFVEGESLFKDKEGIL